MLKKKIKSQKDKTINEILKEEGVSGYLDDPKYLIEEKRKIKYGGNKALFFLIFILISFVLLSIILVPWKLALNASDLYMDDILIIIQSLLVGGVMYYSWILARNITSKITNKK